MPAHQMFILQATSPALKLRLGCLTPFPDKYVRVEAPPSAWLMVGGAQPFLLWLAFQPAAILKSHPSVLITIIVCPLGTTLHQEEDRRRELLWGKCCFWRISGCTGLPSLRLRERHYTPPKQHEHFLCHLLTLPPSTYSVISWDRQ